jgi:hypothetical protein
MPHIPNFAPEDLLPRTPKRPRQKPLPARESKARNKRGSGLFDKVSIRNWQPPEDMEDALSEVFGDKD